ncbi:nagb/rpia/CoA transferase-like protein [Lophiostoma macrostomum CBS 122681]|uniref:Nagb/rpia/CoA transferase-like protein n=1 Tax=Lophiostoma macrostomum CBS 122681 TaxID=1314788 RepID=A0A6A6SJW3_9PLEO|nr:nagb/rpia/CoA transferase-like protein [Lophiostoma macrostomum CBS 122681]
MLSPFHGPNTMDYSAYALLPRVSPSKSISPSLKSASPTVKRLFKKPSKFSLRRRQPSTSTSSSQTYGSIITSPLASPSKRVDPSEQPPTPPRSPAKENEEFESLLSSAVQELQEDYVSGARQMADSSLSNLASLIEAAADTARDREELWGMSARVAWELCGARPSMGAAITSVLLRSLNAIAQLWDTETTTASTAKTPTELARIAGYRIEQTLHERKDAGLRLGQHFSTYIRENILNVRPSPTTIPIPYNPTLEANRDGRTKHDTRRVHILTLSNSSTIRGAIQSLITTLSTAYLPPSYSPPSANPALLITVLESRPRCEGADMASQILNAISSTHSFLEGRVKLRVAPDCAVGSIMSPHGLQNPGFGGVNEDEDEDENEDVPVDILLLGADKISAKGDVSNKVGSLAAALCARHLSPNTQIIVASDTDKIAPPTHLLHSADSPKPSESASQVERVQHEHHPSEELSATWHKKSRESLGRAERDGTVQVHGEWFEWVPKEYIDVYVTDKGVLDREGVEEVALEVAELSRKIFGE